MTAIIYADDYISSDTLPDFVQHWFLAERPLFDQAEKNAASAYGVTGTLKGRFAFDGEWNNTQRFMRTKLERDIITTKLEGGKALHAHFISKGYLPADFAYETGDGDFGKQYLTMELLLKAMRKHNPDTVPKDFKSFIPWLKAEVLEAIGPQMEAAQAQLLKRITAHITARERETVDIWSETVPSIRTLANAYPQALYDTHFASHIRDVLNKADKAAQPFGLAIDDDAFQAILYTPAYYLGYLAAYKPFHERIMDNSAMEKLTEEAVQRGVGSFSLARHPALSMLHYTYPESKFNAEFHLHTRIMRNRIKTKAKEHNIAVEDQLLDNELYSVASYRDYHMMALMKPASGYRYDDAEGFKLILGNAINHGIITAPQAAQLEERRLIDVAEQNPFGTWDEHTRSIVAHALIKSVKPIPAPPQTKAPRRYERLGRIIDAARSVISRVKGSSNDARPNP